MFETLAINFRDQGQGGPPWDEPADGGMGEDYNGDDPEVWDGQGKDDPEVPMTAEGQPVPPEVEEMFVPEEEAPIQVRASEEELLYAHLQIKTDFENEFIEEMLEFEPNEEEWERINELRKKRMSLRQQPNQNPFGQMGGMPPQGMAPQGNGGITTILV